MQARPNFAPELKLAKVHSAATTYHLVPKEEREKGFGWALCTVNDATGELTITSDWGNWSHRWSADPKHLGAPSLTHFIGSRGACNYLADKLSRESGPRSGEEFDPEATVKKFRGWLAERRLEQGRDHRELGWDPDDHARAPSSVRQERYWHDIVNNKEPLTRRIAREIWDALGGELQECRSADLFIERFFKIQGCSWITEEPWEYAVYSPTTGYQVLLHSILPALVEACFARVFPGRHRCELRMMREDGAGHWRDWHRGHGCHLDDSPIATNANAEEAPHD
jgi:hypothetical protein